MYQLSFCVPFSSIRNARDFTPAPYGQFLFFGTGKFDDYCAYIGTRSMLDGQLYCAMPLDKYYFNMAVQIANVYGYDRLYDDIRHMYEHTGKTIDRELIAHMYTISLSYGYYQGVAYDLMAYQLFLHLYYGMVAEENKANTRIGKMIKMNGIYSLLRANRPVAMAADECRQKSWREIHDECQARQIYRGITP